MQNSNVKRWDLVTVGNLARNPYWGEADGKLRRSTLCTCTLLRGESFRLLVDPSLADAEQMNVELNRRTGLTLSDIDSVFITHEHADHWFGLKHFPNAAWFAAAGVAAILNQNGKLPKPVESASGRLHDAVDLVATPGHTMNHHSLRFDCDGLSVVIAGDAVMTRDFWNERRGHGNGANLELAAKSMETIAGLADLVVPGHDNYFVNVAGR